MADTKTLTIHLHDSSRSAPITAQNPVPDADDFTGQQSLITLRDGFSRQVHREFHGKSEITFSIPFEDGPRDSYTVLVAADNRRDAGFMPVPLGQMDDLHLMLPRKGASFTFTPLSGFPAVHSRMATLLALPGPAAGTYDDWRQVPDNPPAPGSLANPAGLATLLNVLAAVDEILNPGGQTLLDFYKKIIWDCPKPDRFFAVVDPGLRALLEDFKKKKQDFVRADSSLHAASECTHAEAGERVSYKHTAYKEANVQFTFHKMKGSTDEIVENDIDYFTDTLSHLLLEVIPNEASKLIPGHRRVTDPRHAFLLRWMQERNGFGGTPQRFFNPPFQFA